jgi:hypothetical protein
METEIKFYDALTFGIQGKAFTNCSKEYSRLPKSAEHKELEAVYPLSLLSAGLYVEFCTDSKEIHARLKLVGRKERPILSAPNSIDLYMRHSNKWKWAGILKNLELPLTQGAIQVGFAKGKKCFRLYMPHDSEVESLEIGITEGSIIEPMVKDARKPVICYGTSIVHGFWSSRPGMTMPAQLGRKLDYPVINLGFSGNARMHPDFISYIQEIDPAVFVIDCLPNMGPKLVLERTSNFIKAIRTARPETPILLVENIVYQATYMLEDKRGGWGQKNDALKEVYAGLLKDGYSNIYYLCGEGLLGCDGDATVDGTHPTDLGMERLASAYENALRPILNYAK